MSFSVDGPLAVTRPDIQGSFMDFDLQRSFMGFVGRQILKPVEVGAASGKHGRVTLQELLKHTQATTKRQAEGGYGRTKTGFDTVSFVTDEYGHEALVHDGNRNTYRDWMQHDLVASLRARDTVLRGEEVTIAGMVFNASTWTGSTLTTAISNEWDDSGNCTPIADVNAARNRVWNQTGMWPNALVINRKVFHNLRAATDIKNAIASSGAGFATRATDITTAQLAEVFDLPYIIVADQPKNTAGEGLTPSISPIWSDEYAMVCRVAETSDIEEPCIGRTYVWPGDGAGMDGIVEQYREEKDRSDVFRFRMNCGYSIVESKFGHLLSNVTT